MKKLNDAKLKTIDFSQDEILSKASLKAITGGFKCECGHPNGEVVDLGEAATILECSQRCAAHIEIISRE